MSGSTSPQQPVPALLYSQLDQYENNNNNSISVQIKSEYDFDSVSSVKSSPHIVAPNEFEQLSHPLCDDNSTSPTSTTTSDELTFNLSISQYYSIIQSTPLDQSSGVQPGQMKFIIYEPRQNGDVTLLPTINPQNNYRDPMWSLPSPTSSIDNRPITTVASTQNSLNLPFDYAQNQVSVNLKQISPLSPVSSSSPQQPPQQPSTQQGQQQLHKCPYDDCPKTFSRLYNLKSHLLSHSPARPYQCSTCPRSFSRKHDLQRHIRIHTGIKPYQCSCCKKAFARTDALRRHFKMGVCKNSNMKKGERYSEMH